MAHVLDYEPQLSTPRPSRWRWIIAGMLFLAAILNYMDRVALSQLAPTITQDLKLTEWQYGWINIAFMATYTGSLLVSGRLVDWMGTRLSMALFVSWWSISNMMTGWARSFATLLGCRSLLGLGEAGNWPASAKTVSERFPASERGMAIGFYTMGATIGATLTPWMINVITRRAHWEWVFVVTGALGLGWVVLWLLVSPLGAPAAEPVKVEEPVQSERQRWREVLQRSDVWALMVGRMLTDPVWFFYQVWFAKYLYTERAVAKTDLSITWKVYLAADIGCLLGGFFSGLFIRRGFDTVKSRMGVMGVCALLMPLSMFITWMPTTAGSVAIAMIVVFAHLTWLVNISALLVDVVPQRYVATAFGVMAAGSGLGGMAMNALVPTLISHWSYAPWYYIAAVVHPVAWVLLWTWARSRSRPLDVMRVGN